MSKNESLMSSHRRFCDETPSCSCDCECHIINNLTPKEAKEPKSFDGRNLALAYTLNTMYANNKIELQDGDGNVFRIDVSEVLKLLQKQQFTVAKQRKYNHLTLI